MRRIGVFKGVAIALAMLGIAFPQAQILAAESKKQPKPNVQVVAANTIFDVKLPKSGDFTGRVIDHAGTPVVGTKVVVKLGKTAVGTSMTDERGNFSVPNLKPGSYEVSSGATVGSYRMWSEKTAPPSAKPHGLLVLGENGARGQYGLTETIAGENLGLILLASTTGLALAALIIALHAKDVADSAESKSP